MKKVKVFPTVKKITIAIFYHEDIEACNRRYWVGILAQDGSCQRVLKTMRGTGYKAYQSAVSYLVTL